MFFTEKHPPDETPDCGGGRGQAHFLDEANGNPQIPASCTRGNDQVTFLNLPSTYRQITDVSEYQFDDIGPDDIVIDIGANAGAFCIRASRHAGRVFAVEPVTAGILRENIKLNNADVTVLEGALGEGKPVEICWDTCRAVVPGYTLRHIIGLAGGCTFLKCDCEGAEWLISPGDLDGIRRIEMELHLPPISGPPNPALLDYISRHFHFGIDRKPVHSTLGVMGILHAVRKT
jgi:hypothetical protein